MADRMTLAALVTFACAIAVTHTAIAGCAVDNERLHSAGGDAANWIMAGHDYSNQHFSALTGIDKHNIGRLAPRWIFQSGLTGSFQAEPLVVDRQMYVTTVLNDLVRLDGATGEQIWRYRHTLRTDKRYGGPTSRGAALGYGKVYEATIDGQVLALDCDNGALAWKKTVVHPEQGESESLALLGATQDQFTQEGGSRLGYNMPPLVADGKIAVGVAGAGFDMHVSTQAGGDVVNGGGSVIGLDGGYGRRGFLSAFAANDGAELWRWYSTSDTGWEGQYRENTPDGVPLHRDIAAERAAAEKYRGAWRVGGGSLWMRPAYDPASGLLYAGTGNPSPQNYGASRPGDNLYTSGLAALALDDGRLDWFYQQVPHNVWGYEQAAPPFLFERNGHTVVAAASKDGWIYVNDARTGELMLKSEPLVDTQNLFEPPSDAGTLIRPGPAGAASWYPTSFDANSGLAYVQVLHSAGVYTTRTARKADGSTIEYVQTSDAESEPVWGTLTAVNLADKGQIAWSVKTDSRATGGTLATASGLVFSGQSNGMFKAYDAATGEELWHFNVGAGISGPPIAYAVDGVQYIAVAAGGTALFQREGPGVGDAFVVFALLKEPLLESSRSRRSALHATGKE